MRDLGFWCKPSPEAAASEEAHRHPTTASASLDSTSVLQDPEFPDPATTRVSGTEVTEGIQDAGEFRGGFQGRVAEIDGASSCSLDYETVPSLVVLRCQATAPTGSNSTSIDLTGPFKVGLGGV